MPGPLLHATVALSLYRSLSLYTLSHNNNNQQNQQIEQTILEIWLLLSSITPDGLDKPLYYRKITSCTRTYGHTLLFLFSVSAFLYCFSAPFSINFFLGCLSHLVADRFFGYVPFFWPLQPFKYPSMVHTKTTKMLLFTGEAFGFLYLITAIDWQGWGCLLGVLCPCLVETLKYHLQCPF